MGGQNQSQMEFMQWGKNSSALAHTPQTCPILQDESEFQNAECWVSNPDACVRDDRKGFI